LDKDNASIESMASNTSLNIGVQWIEQLNGLKMPHWLSAAIQAKDLPVLVDSQEKWGLSGDHALAYM
jgi:hypothetical protein